MYIAHAGGKTYHMIPTDTDTAAPSFIRRSRSATRRRPLKGEALSLSASTASKGSRLILPTLLVLASPGPLLLTIIMMLGDDDEDDDGDDDANVDIK